MVIITTGKVCLNDEEKYQIEFSGIVRSATNARSLADAPYGIRVPQQNAGVHADLWSFGECRIKIITLVGVLALVAFDPTVFDREPNEPLLIWIKTLGLTAAYPERMRADERKTVKKIAILMAASTITAVLSWGAAAQKEEPIKIGLVVSLSGPAAPYGIPERDSAMVLAEKINGAGGVNGRPIELLVHDDMTNPTEAARAATKLVEQDKVVAIIGASTGSGTLALSPIATRAKVPVLAPNATITVILRESPNYPWVFRTMSNDTVNAQKLFDAAIAGGAKTIGILFQEDAYGKDAAEYMQQLAQVARIKVVSVVSAPLKAIDLTAQATKLRNEKPDVILLQVNAVALGAAFARAARQVGLEAPMWSSMGLGQAAFLDAAAGAADGMRMVVVGNWDDPSPRQAELGELLKKAGKKPAGFAELLSTNGLLAIVEAAKKIEGPVTGEAIRDQLERLCPLRTYADGQLCYTKDDHDGWSAETLMSVEVKDGKFARR